MSMAFSILENVSPIHLLQQYHSTAYMQSFESLTQTSIYNCTCLPRVNNRENRGWLLIAHGPPPAKDRNSNTRISGDLQRSHMSFALLRATNTTTVLDQSQNVPIHSCVPVSWRTNSSSAGDSLQLGMLHNVARVHKFLQMRRFYSTRFLCCGCDLNMSNCMHKNSFSEQKHANHMYEYMLRSIKFCCDV